MSTVPVCEDCSQPYDPLMGGPCGCDVEETHDDDDVTFEGVGFRRSE